MIGIGIGLEFPSSPTSGGGAVAATGAIELTDAPSVGETLTVGGKTWTFSTSPGEGVIRIVGGASGTTSQIRTAINTDTEVTLCLADFDGESETRLILTAIEPGAAGNSIPLATDSAVITLTPFSGGS